MGVPYSFRLGTACGIDAAPSGELSVWPQHESEQPLPKSEFEEAERKKPRGKTQTSCKGVVLYFYFFHISIVYAKRGLHKMVYWHFTPIHTTGMKYLYILIGLAVLGTLGFVLWTPAGAPTREQADQTVTDDDRVAGALAQEQVAADRHVVEAGSYTVVPEESTIRWAGKKPLIEGYVNTGSFSLTGGSIAVRDAEATGEFVIDMNTLSVSDTPTKPGMESTLEGHLKSDRWFAVEGYPTATFRIVEVTPLPDSSTTFVYTVRGELTLKGQTHEVTFPATIYEDADGMVHADASFEFDRTKWGITAGSGSFFDNLADNVIDDMVALSFSVVAR